MVADSLDSLTCKKLPLNSVSLAEFIGTHYLQSKPTYIEDVNHSHSGSENGLLRFKVKLQLIEGLTISSGFGPNKNEAKTQAASAFLQAYCPRLF